MRIELSSRTRIFKERPETFHLSAKERNLRNHLLYLILFHKIFNIRVREYDRLVSHFTHYSVSVGPSNL
jgi:hypothetical protein